MPNSQIKVVLLSMTSFARLLVCLMTQVMQAVKYLHIDLLKRYAALLVVDWSCAL